jgi:hypothetical protein
MRADKVGPADEVPHTSGVGYADEVARRGQP